MHKGGSAAGNALQPLGSTAASSQPGIDLGAEWRGSHGQFPVHQFHARPSRKDHGRSLGIEANIEFSTGHAGIAEGTDGAAHDHQSPAARGQLRVQRAGQRQIGQWAQRQHIELADMLP